MHASAPITGPFDIVGVGYCGCDHVCLLPFIPQDDKIEIAEHLIQGGGPAATATVAASRLGSRTAFIGAVGDDAEGRSILADFARDGVAAVGVAVQAGAASPTAYCWVERSTGLRSIAWSRGSTRTLDPAHVEANRGLLAGVRALHCDGHHLPAALHAAELVRAAGGTVSLDAGSPLPGIEALVARTDICIASERFARAFTGETSIEAAARRLRALGPAVVGVTSGMHGAFALDAAGEHRQAAFPVAVVDTTGAGDTFHGAFLHAWLESRSTPHALRIAAATAALKCTALGGRTGIPDRARVDAFLEGRA